MLGGSGGGAPLLPSAEDEFQFELAADGFTKPLPMGGSSGALAAPDLFAEARGTSGLAELGRNGGDRE
jgi:hypothetical protein